MSGCNLLVSVVVPVYNVEMYLDKCIESLLSQTYTNFELILVDDGSTDTSSSMIDRWCLQDRRIHAFHKENGGLSSARNYGIDLASGELITFVDSDDYVEDCYLEDLVHLISGDEKISMGCCGFNVIEGNTRRHGGPAPKGIVLLNKREAFEEVLYHGLVDVSAWAKIYRVDLFSNLRFPEGLLYEDTWLFGYLLNNSNLVALTPKSLYNYVKRDGSIVSGGFTEARLQYSNSVDELVKQALLCDRDLIKGCLRRKTHAKLSILRYMKSIDSKYASLRDRLRDEALSHFSTVFFDRKTPLRDRFALIALKLGYLPFYKCWDIYERNR